MEVEALLKDALAPVEPPEGLATRLESTLSQITELASEELAEWEAGSMRDPRNWVKPVVAVAVGGAAATALLLLRSRKQAKSGPLPDVVSKFVEQSRHSAHDLAQRSRSLL